MEKTVVMSCVFLFISSLLLVDAMVRVPKSTWKGRYRDDNFEDMPGFVRTNTAKQVMEHDKEFRRNICLSARELDCEKEFQDQ